MASTVKEWQVHVTVDLRHHLVGKIVNAMCPNPQSIDENGLKALIEHARNIEREMFESADDREGYYHILAEKIYELQKNKSLGQSATGSSNQSQQFAQSSQSMATNPSGQTTEPQ